MKTIRTGEESIPEALTLDVEMLCTLCEALSRL